MIGISLIASNISTEHFVGMAGQGFMKDIGLAIASYEWIAALALIIVAVFKKVNNIKQEMNNFNSVKCTSYPFIPLKSRY